MSNELLFSYIDRIPFEQKELINEVEKNIRNGRLSVKGKKMDLFWPIQKWEMVKVYSSGQRIITPFCLKAVDYNGWLHLRLDKKALSDLEPSLNLARKQNAPFGNEYTAILAHWINKAGTHLEVDKNLFRTVLWLNKETDIEKDILAPAVKELKAVYPDLNLSITEDSYIFTR